MYIFKNTPQEKIICANCFFFLFDPDVEANSGRCVRYAPRPVLVNSNDIDNGDYFYVWFPVVEYKQCCGEWKEKNWDDIDESIKTEGKHK